jgi:type VI secretion system secreted protein VgrG
MQEEAAGGLVIRGGSSCPRLMAGHRFTLERHFNADGVYVLTGVKQRATLEGDYRSTRTQVKLLYENTFRAIPVALPFRPPRATQLPRVEGSQTAVVVGPAGEEIFTDKYGRIKVQFHWDRQGKNDGDSSCWVRVATPWAGKQWGMIHIPRIGQEVVVDFEEGDPDHPIVVGCVYNAEQMPPYALPANKTQSGIKTRSSLHGTPSNFNEIRFEDKKGSEQLFIHAEKNQDIEVENDETHWVGHDRKKTIDHDETTHVKHDRTETVDNNETITIQVNRTETVGKDETIAIGKNRTERVGVDESITVGRNRSRAVGVSEDVTVGMNQSVEAGTKIQLTCGQSSITIDQTGVTIQGLLIKIKGQVMVQVDGPITQVNADALLMLKGGLTLIN